MKKTFFTYTKYRREKIKIKYSIVILRIIYFRASRVKNKYPAANNPRALFKVVFFNKKNSQNAI